MNALILFDSQFGNTKLIADAIAEGFGEGATSHHIDGFKFQELKDLDLLIVGSPINGWRPTQNTVEFIENLGKDKLNGIRFTTFDTRVKLFIHGDAMLQMAKGIENAGGKLLIEPQAFYVSGKEGPLSTDEIKRANAWGSIIKERLTQTLSPTHID